MTNQEAIEELDYIYKILDRSEGPETFNALYVAKEVLKQQKKGKWLNEQLIPNNIDGHMYGECSICGKLRIIDNFCPNCGADMKGE